MMLQVALNDVTREEKNDQSHLLVVPDGNRMLQGGYRLTKLRFQRREGQSLGDFMIVLIPPFHLRGFGGEMRIDKAEFGVFILEADRNSTLVALHLLSERCQHVADSVMLPSCP